VEVYASAAGLEALEKAEQAAGEEEALLEFSDFVGGESAPAGRDGRVGTEAVEEKFDFGEGEVHFGGEADEEKAVESVIRVAALAVAAVGEWKEADRFVVADSGRGEAGLSGKSTDFHCRLAPRIGRCGAATGLFQHGVHREHRGKAA